MSYLYTVLSDNPLGLWPLDANVSSQFADASGNGNTATVISGVATVKPIVGGGVAAQLLSGSGWTLPITGIMQSGFQSQPFTYEFWVRPTAIAAGSMSLFKRTSSVVTLSTNNITVSLAMSSTVTLAYSGLNAGTDYHIIVTYDGFAVELYVNDVVVVTQYVTAANFLAGFTDVASTLSFSATGGYTAVIDSLAIYNFVLDQAAIDSHYNTGTTYPSATQISGFSNSHQYRIADYWSTVFDQIYAADDTAWDSGVFSSGAVASSSDKLVNTWSDTTSQFQAGTWIETIAFEAQSVTLAGSRITWDSNITGLDVKVSTDGGTTFNSVSNGGNPVGAFNLTSAGLTVVVKITFVAGATQTTVSKLNLVLYASKNINGTNGVLPITVQDPNNVVLAEFDSEPASFNNLLGAVLSTSTARLDIAADSVFGGYTAMEFLIWIPSTQLSKTVMASTAGTPPGITTNGSGQWVFTNFTALYLDGVSISSATTIPTTGMWHHVIAVFASASGTFYFGNNAAQNAAYNCSIGYIATHLSTLTSTQVTNIYNALVGTAPVRVTDASTTTVTEHILAASLPVRAYAYNWSGI